MVLHVRVDMNVIMQVSHSCIMCFCLFLAAGFVRNERHQRFACCHDAAESGSVGALAGGSSGGWWRENQGL